jgi:restriction system protein
VRAFLDQGFVGVSWGETGSLAGVTELRAIEERLAAVFEGKSHRTLTAWAAMLRSIGALMSRGDAVMTLEPESRRYWIGQITSDYQWQGESFLAHRRLVNWIGSLERTHLSTPTLHCLGAISTVFRLSTAATEEVVSQFRKHGVLSVSARRLEDITRG